MQRVGEQRFLSGDQAPQGGFQLQRHQQTGVVCADHLHTSRVKLMSLHWASCYVTSAFILKETNRWTVFVPAGRPWENLRYSFLPGACRGDGCAESLGSQCRCPEPEPELSGPHVEPRLPWCDRTAAVGPKHNSNRQEKSFYNSRFNQLLLICICLESTENVCQLLNIEVNWELFPCKMSLKTSAKLFWDSLAFWIQENICLFGTTLSKL